MFTCKISVIFAYFNLESKYWLSLSLNSLLYRDYTSLLLLYKRARFLHNGPPRYLLLRVPSRVNFPLLAPGINRAAHFFHSLRSFIHYWTGKTVRAYTRVHAICYIYSDKRLDIWTAGRGIRYATDIRPIKTRIYGFSKRRARPGPANLCRCDAATAR